MKFSKYLLVIFVIISINSCRNTAFLRDKELKKTDTIVLAGVCVNKYFVSKNILLFSSEKNRKKTESEIISAIGNYAWYLMKEKKFSKKKITEILKDGHLTEGEIACKYIVERYLEFGRKYSLNFTVDRQNHTSYYSKLQKNLYLQNDFQVPDDFPDTIKHIIENNRSEIARIDLSQAVFPEHMSSFSSANFDKSSLSPKIRKYLKTAGSPGSLYVFIDFNFHKSRYITKAKSNLSCDVTALIYDMRGRLHLSMKDSYKSELTSIMVRNLVFDQQENRGQGSIWWNINAYKSGLGYLEQNNADVESWKADESVLDDLVTITMITMIDQIEKYVKD